MSEIENFKPPISAKYCKVFKLQISFIDLSAGVVVLFFVLIFSGLVYSFPTFSLERNLKKEWRYYRDNCISNLTLEDFRHNRFTIQYGCKEEILKKYEIEKGEKK